MAPPASYVEKGARPPCTTDKMARILHFASYEAEWCYISSHVVPTANAGPQSWDRGKRAPWPSQAGRLWDEARFPNPLIG